MQMDVRMRTPFVSRPYRQVLIYQSQNKTRVVSVSPVKGRYSYFGYIILVMPVVARVVGVAAEYQARAESGEDVV